ncbi:hypothetical protein BO71DRAFT_413265 [Aspergillus ellipticus CBS 707.79]|uniref:Uncharacterized protein n=1 Tax=Aspergillus ellipticus CBS 707.79 TaxID=1448320 RepID=A0A319EET2_9EURO|nr:hypothetical protein BO71DRAFT_413265 [Aspergillus ellipticus CBS 707.79]
MPFPNPSTSNPSSTPQTTTPTQTQQQRRLPPTATRDPRNPNIIYTNSSIAAITNARASVPEQQPQPQPRIPPPYSPTLAKPPAYTLPPAPAPVPQKPLCGTSVSSTKPHSKKNITPRPSPRRR